MVLVCKRESFDVSKSSESTCRVTVSTIKPKCPQVGLQKLVTGKLLFLFRFHYVALAFGLARIIFILFNSHVWI